MTDVREARRRFSLVMIVLLCVDVAAAVVLVSPIGRGARSGQQHLEELWNELRTKDREVIPLRGIDQKVVEAKGEIADFYRGRLPSSYSQISEELGKVAGQTKVKISAGKYESEPAEVPGLLRVRVAADVSGDYVEAVKFINALEREKMFFLVDSVSVGESQGGAVRLQINLETYLKST